MSEKAHMSPITNQLQIFTLAASKVHRDGHVKHSRLLFKLARLNTLAHHSAKLLLKLFILFLGLLVLLSEHDNILFFVGAYFIYRLIVRCINSVLVFVFESIFFLAFVAR